jgi:general secretion pathway protein G
MRRTRRHGFTLLEMMVVIALIGLLSAIVAVSVYGVYGPARVEATKSQLVAAKAAVQTFYVLHKRHPADLQELLDRGVLDALPRDGWGRPIVYRLEDGRPVLVSFGEDGQVGGEGRAADLSSNTGAERK